jgi:2-iminobutanoate/2-iminopropanoate deaminase
MEIVKTKNAPAAIGPYSQAVKSGGFVFCSGQIALKPDGELLEGDVRAQTTQVMNNLKAVLEAVGSDFSKVVKTTIFLADINDFVDVNEVYGSYFEGENKPARATVEVSNLPKGVKVEVDCVAEG